MERELRIVRTFVEMADAMIGHLDPFDFLHTLCRRCVELLDCDEAGVLIVAGRGGVGVMGSSSERIETLELLQANATGGPCLDAIRTGQVIASPDLSTERQRWPAFADAAGERGLLAVRTIPLKVRDEKIGALTLFRSRPGDIASDDHELAHGIADMASIALVQDRVLHESESLAQQLQHALDARVVIEQAKGVLAERQGIDMDAGFGLMRDYARGRNLRLHDVADRLVSGQLEPDAFGNRLTA